MSKRSIFLAAVIILASGYLCGFEKKAAPKSVEQKRPQETAPHRTESQPPSKAGSFVSSETKNAMRITLKTSRDQATQGSSFGITAEIENVSSLPIYTMPSAIAMTVPPELDDGGPHDLWAFIPGIQVPPNQNYWDTVIVLEPGSVIPAVWSGGSLPGSSAAATNTSLTTQTCRQLGMDCGKFFRGLGFSPGRYTLTIVSSYWDTYEGAQTKSVERHTEISQIQETITAPQSVILFGAALGGIIAFLLLTKLQPSSTTGWSSVGWIPGLLSAVLLSAIVTILIARLSQSQFIISVTVNDFWGAIAVGFIITAAGPSILRKFSGLLAGSGSAPSVAPQPLVTPVATEGMAGADPGTPASNNGLAMEGSGGMLSGLKTKP